MENQIEEIEIGMQELKSIIAKKQCMDRLVNNSDWRKLIEDDYFVQEASRLVLLKADMNVQSDSDQKRIDKSIDAIGYFREYLRSIRQLGERAERDLIEFEQTREELLEEQLEN